MGFISVLWSYNQAHGMTIQQGKLEVLTDMEEYITEKTDAELVKFFKEFQIYGWFQEKFNMLNFQNTEDEKLIKEYKNIW